MTYDTFDLLSFPEPHPFSRVAQPLPVSRRSLLLHGSPASSRVAMGRSALVTKGTIDPIDNMASVSSFSRTSPPSRRRSMLCRRHHRHLVGSADPAHLRPGRHQLRLGCIRCRDLPTARVVSFRSPVPALHTAGVLTGRGLLRIVLSHRDDRGRPVKARI